MDASSNNSSKDDAVSSINTSSSSCCSDLVEQCYAALKHQPWDEDSKLSNPRQTAKQQFAAKRKQQQQQQHAPSSPPRHHQRRNTDLTAECAAESPSLSPERKKKKRAAAAVRTAEPAVHHDHEDFAAQPLSNNSLADNLTGGPSDEEEEEELPRPLLEVEDDDVDLDGSFQRQPGPPESRLFQEIDDAIDSKMIHQKQGATSGAAVAAAAREGAQETTSRNNTSLGGVSPLQGEEIALLQSSHEEEEAAVVTMADPGAASEGAAPLDNIDKEAVLVMKTWKETLFPAPPPPLERGKGELDVVEKKEHIICGVAQEAQNDDAVMVESQEGTLHSDERRPEKLRVADDGDDQPGRRSFQLQQITMGTIANLTLQESLELPEEQRTRTTAPEIILDPGLVSVSPAKTVAETIDSVPAEEEEEEDGVAAAADGAVSIFDISVTEQEEVSAADLLDASYKIDTDNDVQEAIDTVTVEDEDALKDPADARETLETAEREVTCADLALEDAQEAPNDAASIVAQEFLDTVEQEAQGVTDDAAAAAAIVAQETFETAEQGVTATVAECDHCAVEVKGASPEFFDSAELESMAANLPLEGVKEAIDAAPMEDDAAALGEPSEALEIFDTVDQALEDAKETVDVVCVEEEKVDIVAAVATEEATDSRESFDIGEQEKMASAPPTDANKAVNDDVPVEDAATEERAAARETVHNAKPRVSIADAPSGEVRKDNFALEKASKTREPSVAAVQEEMISDAVVGDDKDDTLIEREGPLCSSAIDRSYLKEDSTVSIPFLGDLEHETVDDVGIRNEAEFQFTREAYPSNVPEETKENEAVDTTKKTIETEPVQGIDDRALLTEGVRTSIGSNHTSEKDTFQYTPNALVDELNHSSGEFHYISDLSCEGSPHRSNTPSPMVTAKPGIDLGDDPLCLNESITPPPDDDEEEETPTPKKHLGKAPLFPLDNEEIKESTTGSTSYSIDESVVSIPSEHSSGILAEMQEISLARQQFGPVLEEMQRYVAQKERQKTVNPRLLVLVVALLLGLLKVTSMSMTPPVSTSNDESNDESYNESLELRLKIIEFETGA